MKKIIVIVLNVQMSPDDCLIICWLLVVGVVNMIDELKLIPGVSCASNDVWVRGARVRG